MSQEPEDDDLLPEYDLSSGERGKYFQRYQHGPSAIPGDLPEPDSAGDGDVPRPGSDQRTWTSLKGSYTGTPKPRK